MASRRQAANGPRSGASPHSEAVAAAQAALTRLLEGGREPRDRSWERYLHSSRRFPPVPPAPLSPEDMRKLADAQADVIVEVIEGILDGLALSPEQYEHGRKLASELFAAVVAEGWSPLW